MLLAFVSLESFAFPFSCGKKKKEKSKAWFKSLDVNEDPFCALRVVIINEIGAVLQAVLPPSLRGKKEKNY